MTTDPFNAPGKGDRFSAADHNGDLLLITPHSYEEGIETSFGTKDAVKATIVVVDEKAPAESKKIEGALLFGGRLIGQTKAFVGKGLVLGRLEQGEAKKGQNPPWQLADPTDDDKTVARAYLATTAPQL